MRFVSVVSVLLSVALGTLAHGAYVGSLIDYRGGSNTLYATGLAAVYDSEKKPKLNYEWDDLNVGDIVVVILKATKIESDLAPAPGITDDVYTGEWTKYLALQIQSKETYGTGFGKYTFTGGSSPGWDPFEKLMAGEVMGIWLDEQKDFAVNAPIYGTKNGSRWDEVDGATDGALFATFGLGAVDGYYTPFTLTLLGGVTVVRNPLNLQWVKVSNPLGGTTDLAIAGLVLSGKAVNESDWDYFASNSERFRVTPEPGTVTALLAMGGAAGLGLALRRKKPS